MSDFLKEAFLDGAKDAIADLTGKKKEEESTLRKVLPWVLAGGAGLAGYKYLRTPSFSKNVAMRAMQQKAVRKGFHHVVDVTPTKYDGNGVIDRLNHFFTPRADTKGKLDLWNKAKLLLRTGTTDSIPVSRVGKKLVHANGTVGTKAIDGVAYGRNVDIGGSGLPAKKVIRGGVDLEGSKSTQKAMTELGRKGKAFEADLLKKYAPGSMPDTETGLHKIMQGLKINTPAQRGLAIKTLQDTLKKRFGKNDYILKPNMGLASGGEFPHGKLDWGEELTKYEKYIANKRNSLALEKRLARGENEASDYLREKGLYQGQTLHDVLKDPRSALAQAKIPNIRNEARIHHLQGEAPSSMVMPKQLDNVKKMVRLPLDMTNMGSSQELVEKTIAALPKKYHKGMYGADVIQYTKADGSVGNKIVELNPHEMITTNSGGGGSGHLTADGPNPWGPHGLYRAATGRHTPIAAGLGGLGLGGLAYTASDLAMPSDDDH